MTPDGSGLEAMWTAALASPATTRFRTATSGVVTPSGPVLVAVRDDDVRHLLVPIDPKHSLKEELDGQAVTLRRRVLEDETSYRTYAALALVDASLSDLFTALSVEIIERIAATPSRAVAAMRSVLRDWKALLSGARNVLTPSALTGLFGELYVLRALSTVDAGAAAFWTGPGGTAQDFHRVPDALEVKTSAAVEGRRVRIHGLGQLDVAAPGRLLLLWMRVRTDRGESVPDLIDQILAQVDDPPSVSAALLACGYHPQDRALYASRRFEIVEQRTFTVDAGFPRIVQSQLAGDAAVKGIEAVHYDVDLDSPAATAAMVSGDVFELFMGPV